MAEDAGGRRRAPGARWGDLGRRIATGGALVALGAVEIALGGVWFAAFVIAVTAAMLWECARMLGPRGGLAPVALAAGGAAVLGGVLASGAPAAPAALLLPGALGAALLPRGRLAFFACGTAVLLAGWGLVTLRDANGATWLFWLVLVVVATDVLGYVGGRALGGPKVWPRLSPKKTWAGIVAGWAGAGAVGALFTAFTDAGAALIVVSMLLSFSSQVGDIAESALKRRAGVKDSSSLLPGHGGVLDRFDGLTGATLAVLALTVAGAAPEFGS